jgi:anti-anti-sigma regulatory factor
MLRITTIQETPQTVDLRLDGKITAQWAALLDRECRSHLRRRRVVRIDCANVDFIDARGIKVLNEFPRGEVVLQGTPRFITQMLDSGGR